MKSAKSPAAPALPRRGLLVGAGVTGAAALVVAKLPLAGDTGAAAASAAAKPAETSAGYRLTAHVQRYYQTTKI